ncbi:acetate kinase [Modestobacter roseus]|uniref:Acetate kinase n=1 Tax=Modestobacter roseus TaxID=1181884 RepID=A0A562IQC2_9ACTN|nr:acetate kinase [Modestobacter roseus]MQA34646.1 acetate kinase [Modestobacter roseus]TWH73118.1 acetate kinase [Modestobacter roseus]
MEQQPGVVLTLNVGSSSLRAAVRDPRALLRLHVRDLHETGGELAAVGPGDRQEHRHLPGGWRAALPAVADALTGRGLDPAVVVHRIVLGSQLLTRPRRADDALLARLHGEVRRAPLHLPRQLAVVDEARRLWPRAVVVLCPDGGFHAGLPDEAVALPLPAGDRATGLRRWGFHGLAVQSVVQTVPDLGDAVVVHLGSGCSVTAVSGGRSRHTTMALSPAGGVPSLTRSGDLDPEVVLQLVEARDGDVAAVRTLLNQQSGVRGLSGGRSDVRALLADGDPAADLALRVWVRDVAMAVAGAVTTLTDWRTVVFSGGIGTGSAEVRERVCARLLPLRPGAAAAPGAPSEQLGAAGVRVLTVPVDEEAVLDGLARQLLDASPARR